MGDEGGQWDGVSNKNRLNIMTCCSVPTKPLYASQNNNYIKGFSNYTINGRRQISIYRFQRITMVFLVI